MNEKIIDKTIVTPPTGTILGYGSIILKGVQSLKPFLLFIPLILNTLVPLGHQENKAGLIIAQLDLLQEVLQDIVLVEASGLNLEEEICLLVSHERLSASFRSLEMSRKITSLL